MIQRSMSGDLTLAWRLLWKSPALTLVAVLCLAVAIGLSTAGFTVVHGAFLSALPVPDGDRIVAVQDYHHTGSYNVPITAAEYTARRSRSTSFDSLGAWYTRNMTLNVSGTEPRIIRTAHISPNVFDVLRVEPALGRRPSEADVKPGVPSRVVLGHSLWRNDFGSDPAMIGRTIHLAGAPYLVIGVMPPRFAFPFQEQAWIPTQMNAAAAGATPERLSMFGRLRNGVSRRQATAELSVLAASEDRRDDERTRPLVMPFTRGFMSEEQEWALYSFILGLMAFLGITAANLASLFVARNSARAREIAVRSALGADRARLVRQLLVEASLLGIAGAAAGLLFARAGVVWFESQVEDLPWWADFAVDPVVLGFLLLCALVVTAIAGVGPAVRLTRTSIVHSLHAGARSLAGPRVSRLAAGLLAAQIAVSVGFLSVVSVLAQGLLGFSFQRDQIRGREVLVAQVYLGPPDASELSQAGVDRRAVWLAHFERSQRHFEAIRQRLQIEPGVRHVTLATNFPGNDREVVRIQLQDAAGGVTEPVTTRVAEVGAGFFETLGARIAGRGFDFLNGRSGSAAVIVNTPFARKYFGRESPLGRSLRVVRDDDRAPGPWLEVVGVAPDLGLNPGDSNRADGIYLPFSPSNFARIGVRTDAELAALIPRLHEIVRQEYPTAQVQSVASLEALMNAAEAVFRGLGLGLMLIGGVSLLLSAVSFYSLVSFGVTRRTREIGIRLALGASRSRILEVVLGRELTITVVGGLAGLALGFGLYQLVAGLPFDLEPAGPSLGAVFLGLIVLVGASAGLGPVRRALAVDPAETMRQE